MIIDFHTHSFPDNMASRVIHKLSLNANIRNYSDGTLQGLSDSMKASGVDYSVVLPVATKPSQTETINSVSVKQNENSSDTHLIHFGSIHPDNENYKEIIDGLSLAGIKGIKIHPVFCNIPINDIRFKRIISYASENDIAVITHAGNDVGFPGNESVSVPKIYDMIKDVQPTKLILAHMGGWAQWDQVRELICGENVWIDTSFSVTPLRESTYWNTVEDSSILENKILHNQSEQLSMELFADIVRAHGADKFLFGTDSPWGSQSEMIEAIKSSGLSAEECNLILGENARRLLKL